MVRLRNHTGRALTVCIVNSDVRGVGELRCQPSDGVVVEAEHNISVGYVMGWLMRLFGRKHEWRKGMKLRVAPDADVSMLARATERLTVMVEEDTSRAFQGSVTLPPGSTESSASVQAVIERSIEGVLSVRVTVLNEYEFSATI